MRLNIAKTRVVSCSKKKNILSYDYQLYHAALTRISSIKDLGVFFDSKSSSHNHVDFLFSECIRPYSLHNLKIFPSLECPYVLYFTLVRFEYVSVV
jgi:Uri superfamily endonuclease